MNAEADFLQCFFGVEIFSLFVVGHKFFFAQLIQILHDRIIGRFHFAVVCRVGYAEPGVQLGKQDFNRVNLTIGKILVTAEKVFQVCDVLTESCYLSESSGRVRITVAIVSVAPRFRL